MGFVFGEAFCITNVNVNVLYIAKAIPVYGYNYSLTT